MHKIKNAVSLALGARQKLLHGEPTTPIENALAQAFAACVAVPATRRQLYDATKTTGVKK